ncbi:MAG: DUF1737 domain-containing protein [Azospirillaceae bacterium]
MPLSPTGASMARKLYRFLTGKDDAAFCQRVSDALAEGYRLYGNPTMVTLDGEVRVGQAIVLPEAPVAGSADAGQD